jgi:hypothetical protein
MLTYLESIKIFQNRDQKTSLLSPIVNLATGYQTLINDR